MHLSLLPFNLTLKEKDKKYSKIDFQMRDL